MREILAGGGLERIKLDWPPEAWSTKPRAAIRPYFAPQLVYRGGVYEILGGVGVDVTDFGKYWKDLLHRFPSDDKQLLTPLLVVFITNLDDFRWPVAIDDSEAGAVRERIWLNKIIDILSELPASPSALLSDLQREALGPFRLPRFVHWLKWMAFAQWLGDRSIGLPNRGHRPEIIPEDLLPLYNELARRELH